MKKLTLDLEGLQVESFSIIPDAQERRGTVRAHSTLECYDRDRDALITNSWSCWCTAATSEGPNVCNQTDALGCTNYDCITQYEFTCNWMDTHCSCWQC